MDSQTPAPQQTSSPKPPFSKWILLGIVAAFAVIAVVVVGGVNHWWKNGGAPVVQQNQQNEASSSGATYQGYQVKDIYSASVPQDATVTPAQSVTPASPSKTLPTKNRTYTLKATKSGFEPNALTVNAFDTVTLEFTAADGTYDLAIPYLGVSFAPVVQGTTKELVFTASGSGTFAFMCKNACPASGAIQGSLTVIPQTF